MRAFISVTMLHVIILAILFVDAATTLLFVLSLGTMGNAAFDYSLPGVRSISCIDYFIATAIALIFAPLVEYAIVN